MVLVVVAGIAITVWTRVDQKQGDVKPFVKNITIGVIPGYETSFLSYRFVSGLAKDDINSYCQVRELSFRFRFNLSAPISVIPDILAQTKAFRAADVDMILGYPWSSHLCSGARAYGYNKTMVLLTPSASSSIYALRNTTMYHLCVLDFEPIETTLKAMWDRGVRAYILFYGSYGSSENLASMIRIKTGTPHFDYNTTMSYSVDAPLDGFMERADGAVSEMIAKYGVEHTAVLWFRVNPMVYAQSPAEDPFLISVASRPSLSSVKWYTYEDEPRKPTLMGGAGVVASKLRLFTVEQAPLHNPTYDRVNGLWKNSTKLSTDMGYSNAVAYDGFWVLALSAIEANSTDPHDIFKVFPGVAAGYVGASGRCTIGDYSSRLGANYDISAYYEVEGRTLSLRCGSYDWEEDVFTWDESLID
jgi:hypothetical protein